MREFRVPLKELLAQGFSVGEVTAAYRAIMVSEWDDWGSSCADVSEQASHPAATATDYKALYDNVDNPAEVKRLLLSAAYDDVDKYRDWVSPICFLLSFLA